MPVAPGAGPSPAGGVGGTAGSSPGAPKVVIDRGLAMAQSGPGYVPLGVPSVPGTATTTSTGVATVQTTTSVPTTNKSVGTALGTYMCHTCSYDIASPPCIFCPRRGGLMLPTEDGRYR